MFWDSHWGTSVLNACFMESCHLQNIYLESYLWQRSCCNLSGFQATFLQEKEQVNKMLNSQNRSFLPWSTSLLTHLNKCCQQDSSASVFTQSMQHSRATTLQETNKTCIHTLTCKIWAKLTPMTLFYSKLPIAITGSQDLSDNIKINH